MENELLLLQQKISSLEQRLTHGKISLYNQNKQEKSRLEINMDLYEAHTQVEDTRKENEGRRSNSVAVVEEQNECKGSLSGSKGRIKRGDSSLRQSKTISLGKEKKDARRYMHPTDSSSKKSKRSVSRQILRNKVTSLNLNKTSFDKKSLINNQNGFLFFMQRLYKYHRAIQRESEHNRVFKVVFYVFCPYILAMMIMVKMHLQKTEKSRYKNI